MTLAAVKRRLADESGMTLVEVLTSAIVLVIVSLGVTQGIDAASNASGAAKHKTTASMLAQSDQERMRSFASPSLARYNDTRTKVVRGVTFTIESRARWVSDDSGTESCGSPSAEGDDGASYLRITSTVTWHEMRGMRPVVATSLVAPPNGSFGEDGSLLIEILDRNGEGVEGLDVTVEPLSGTGSAITETTGTQGCAFFGFLDPGNYRATFDEAGYVDPQGVQAVSQDVGVVASATNRASFLYDLAGALNVSVKTKLPTESGDRDAIAEYITVGHSGLLAPGTRQFTGGLSPMAIEPLFPFTSSYSVYSGNCPGAAPSKNGQPDVFAIVPPGGDADVTVREVALYFPRGTNTLSDVLLTPRSEGCGTAFAGTFDSNHLGGEYTTGDPAVPFGVYDVCVRRNAPPGQPAAPRYHREIERAVDDPNGETIDVTSTDSGFWSSSCLL